MDGAFLQYAVCLLSSCNVIILFSPLHNYANILDTYMQICMKECMYVCMFSCYILAANLDASLGYLRTIGIGYVLHVIYIARLASQMLHQAKPYLWL